MGVGRIGLVRLGESSWGMATIGKVVPRWVREGGGRMGLVGIGRDGWG